MANGSVFRVLIALVALATGAAVAQAQATQRIMVQDSSLNNLVDPPGYETGRPGRLGEVLMRGEGAGTMILIPGLGFGGQVFESLWAGREAAYTVYAVTLAGFGGTAAPPLPPAGTSYGEQTWTGGATAAIESLMAERDLRDIVLVGHWLGGTQIALRLAQRHPDRIRAVVLLSGSARWVPPGSGPAPEMPLRSRIAAVDSSMAPRWFRTVTRETWDDNNFLPGDYAENPILGLRLWREAARPPLHVWVRYLCEFFAQDATLLLQEVDVPVLLLQPGLEDLYHEPGANYMDAYLRRSWGDALARAPRVRVETVAHSRVVMWADQAQAVQEAMDRFLAAQPSRR